MSISYKSINANDRRINGTSLLGYVTTTYDRLVEVFGPDSGGFDKSDANWLIEFSDGQIATIYNYKTNGLPTKEYQWHIGGHGSYFSKEKSVVVDRIQAIVEAAI